MILRRITEHVKAQNWFAVGLDFFIVVVGVFIGIQVANWNDARSERLDASLVLERLDEDFQIILARTDASLVGHASNVASLARIIEGIKAKQFEEDSLPIDVRKVGDFMVPSGPSSTYSELVSAGRLKLIGNDELRRALKEYDDYVTLVRDSYGAFTERLNGADAELMRALVLETSGIAVAEIDSIDSVEAIDRDMLMHDPEIHTALNIAYTVQNNMYAILAQNRGRVETIIEMIKAEQS